MSSHVLVLSILLGGLSAGLWSNRGLMTTTFHALRLKMEPKSPSSPLSPLSIHQFFLSKGIYVPKEDIFTQETAAPFLEVRKACSKGRIHVWVPLRLRIPIFGEKVIEWCMSLP